MNYGNLINEKIIHIEGEWIYYSNISSDEGKLYKKNLKSNEKVKLSDIEEVQYIHKRGNAIFYTSGASICKLNLTNLENEIIFKGSKDYGSIDDMVPLNDDLFFTQDDIYKMNLNTKEKIKIAENAFGLNVCKYNIYYSANDGDGLYKLNLSTNTIIKLLDTNVSAPIIQGEFIYYFDNDRAGFFRMNMFNNNEEERIIELDKDLIDFNLYKNYIFFSDFYLYKIDIKAKKISRITDIDAGRIHILNEKVWFVSYQEDEREFKLYQMDFDGKNLKLFD